MPVPLVSIIVPTKNSSQFLENCLQSIKCQTYENIELIVVDNSSTDNTQEIARRYTDKVYAKGPERSAQRNYGASQAIGEYIVFIDSDMELSAKVIESCVTAANDEDVKGVIVPEESFGKGFWAQCKKLERSFYVGVDAIEAARFFSKTAFDKAVGYNEALISGEDWDLSDRVEELGNITRIKDFIYHNEGSISLSKTLKKKYYYAKQASAYLKQSKNSTAFSKRKKGFFGRYVLFFSDPIKLLRNPIIGAGMLFMKTCEFGAGAFGLFRFTKNPIKDKAIEAKKTRNILIYDVAPLTFDGGFEKYIINLSLYLHSNNHIRIVTSDKSLSDLITLIFSGHTCEIRVSESKIKERLSDIPLETIGFSHLFPFSKKFYYFRKLFGNSDVIYTNSEIPHILFVKYFLLFNKKPVIVCGAHTPLEYPVTGSLKSKLHNFIYSSWLYRRLLQGTRLRVHVLNASDSTTAINKLGINEENVRIIPNGIDVDKFNVGIKEESAFFRVLFAGRMTEQKGVDTFEKAIRLMSQDVEFSRMEFIFAGTGELEFIARGLEGEFTNVKYLGHVSDMPGLYNKVELLVAPSRWEGFPYSVLEAQACKLPVIASNITGPNTIIKEGQTGFLFEPENHLQLKEDIIKVFNLYTKQPLAYGAMSDESRSNILENFSLDKINHETEEFLCKK